TAVGGFAAREYATVGMEVLKRNLEPAMNVFADVVRNPSFPAEEVEREKKRRLDALSQDAQEPNAIAARVGQMIAFGADHPYGRPVRGLPATVGSLAREDFARFHEANWRPGASALVFVGDITLAEATNLARQSFGNWAGAAPQNVDIPAPRPYGPGKVYLVDRQDAAQTVVVQLLAGPPRKTDDYSSLRLADAVWGGGFGTRLNMNLREEKGYSYGVFSTPSFYSKAGLWTARGGVQTDKTKESVVEFVSELKNFAGAKPITDRELEVAKANRVRGYAQQFESLGRVGNQIVELWAAGLPMSELQRETGELGKATLTSVNTAAQKYALPNGVSLLLVGDLKKIEPGVRELSLGEIVVLDSEGKRK
ncbi:MAG TPA: pitrilysin family protein, partial [Pyrinomonadaceae bacterium]|nr:pitrilysin family protein [Pyrinomonadaceae bacterium]